MCPLRCPRVFCPPNSGVDNGIAEEKQSRLVPKKQRSKWKKLTLLLPDLTFVDLKVTFADLIRVFGSLQDLRVLSWTRFCAVDWPHQPRLLPPGKCQTSFASFDGAEPCWRVESSGLTFSSFLPRPPYLIMFLIVRSVCPEPGVGTSTLVVLKLSKCEGRWPFEQNKMNCAHVCDDISVRTRCQRSIWQTMAPYGPILSHHMNT